MLSHFHWNYTRRMTNYGGRWHSTAVLCLCRQVNVPFPAPNSMKHCWSTSRPNFSKWPTKEAWKRGENPGMGINMNQILMLSGKDNSLPGVLMLWWSVYVPHNMDASLKTRYQRILLPLVSKGGFDSGNSQGSVNYQRIRRYPNESYMLFNQRNISICLFYGIYCMIL